MFSEILKVKDISSSFMCETLDEIHESQLAFVIEKLRKQKE